MNLHPFKLGTPLTAAGRSKSRWNKERGRQCRLFPVASLILVALGASAQAQFSIGGWKPFEKPLDPVKQTVETVVTPVVNAVVAPVANAVITPVVEAVVAPVVNTVIQAPVAVVEAGAKVIDQAAKDIKTGGDDLIKNGQQEVGIAAQNVADEGRRAGVDASDAIQAIGEAPGQIWQLSGDALSQFGSRIQEGKVLDAPWHLLIAPRQIESIVAARMVHQSSLLRTVGEVAADAYGGPVGAAAFAGWYTYNETDDWLVAGKAGFIVGATDAAQTGLDELPISDSTDGAVIDAAKVAVVYVSAKAAGVTDDDAAKAVNTEIIAEEVQGIYSAVTDHNIDTRPAEGSAYDKVEVLDFSDPRALPYDAYARDEAGNIVFENGVPNVIIPKTDFRRPQAGIAGRGLPGAPWYEEGSNFMLTISSFPVMPAVAGFHDSWMSIGHPPTAWIVASILPATVFTFEGTRAPVFDKLTQDAVKSARN